VLRRTALPLLVVLAVVAESAPARKERPPLCPPARYLLPGGEYLLAGDPAPAIDAVIVEDAGAIAVASGCAPTPGKAKRTGRGTRLQVKFPPGSCVGIPGKAKLVVRVDATCETATGTLKAKKRKTAFTAQRSRCGDGIVDTEGGETCDLPPPSAADLLRDEDTGGAVVPGEVSIDANGQPIVRTEIEVAFQPATTPAELDALVASVDGRIVSSLNGVPRVVVRIPDPGSLDGLESVMAALRKQPLVREVRAGLMPGESVLPVFPVLEPPFDIVQDLRLLEHHLAIGAGAAWNARAALRPLSERPFVVVGDFFGDGPPDRAFDISERDEEFETGAASAHGYHVLGIMAARFDGFTESSPYRGRNLATGIYPGTLPVRVVDGQPSHRFENQILLRVLEQLALGTAPVVVNTSVGFLCSNAALAQVNCQNPDHYLGEARTWIEKVRGAGGGSLEGKFLHVTAAGNVEAAGDTDARTDSEYLAAALQPESALGMPPLENVLAVENRTKFTAIRPYRPDCVSTGSKRGGNISAIGDQVFSLNAARETEGVNTAGYRSGTSMAAPQVAGLAAFVLSLRPTLNVAELKALLLATARPVPGCDGPPVIDAYAAVLAADRTGDLAVRRAILDVANANGDPVGDGRFDAYDLFQLTSDIEGNPGDVDYGRADLNGDGRRGGSERARFDLDVNAPPAYTTFTATLGSLGSVTFDESAVTDMEVLCYYAYSPLYAGTAAERSQVLTSRCAPCPPELRAAGGGAGGVCPATTTSTLTPPTTTSVTTTSVTTTTRFCGCPKGFECCGGGLCCF
jgi:subtilisin family serine protease